MALTAGVTKRSRRRVVCVLMIVVALMAITPMPLLGASPESPTRPVWPLRVQPASRYVQDSTGAPFRVNADAAWFAPTEFWLADPASSADFETYLDDREAKGFTAILVMGMVKEGYNDFPGYPLGAYTHLPNNRISGEAPLLVPGDFATPNPAYWDNVAAIVSAAREHGMAVLLAYQYLGYGGFGEQGWWKVIQEPQNTDEVQRGFGRWLAQLLALSGNVIWYPFGDFSPPTGPGLERVRASIEGIRDVIPDAVFAAELDSPDDIVADNPVADELLNADAFYGYGPADHPGEVYRTAERAWAAQPVRPAWVAEPQYEGAGIGGDGSRSDVRHAEYDAVLGGGTAGQTYGAISVYGFAPRAGAGSNVEWHEALSFPGSSDMAIAFELWDSMDWWLLVPSGTAAGFYGLDLTPVGQVSGPQHIPAAGTPDGSGVVAYAPPDGGRARPFSVDLTHMPTTATVVWVDPTTGHQTPIEGVTGGGVRAVVVPGANASGADDWLLVARS